MNPDQTKVERDKEMSLDHAFFSVKEFHKAFGAPYTDTPTLVEKERAATRADWMQEEIEEFLEASKVIDQADAMIDLIYFALGTLVEIGVTPNRLFEIVHEANMTKLWPDGKVHRRADGKVIKHSSWRPPEPRIAEEVARQGNGAGAFSEPSLVKRGLPIE